MNRLRPHLLLLLLLAFSGCGDTARRIDMTLADGSHLSGLLLSVEDDWVVIDRNIAAPDADIMLVDKAVVDTLVIPGRVDDFRQAAYVIGGAIVGGIGGYWIGEGYIPDSTHPADPKRSTAATIGTFSGIALGSGLGVFLADVLSPGKLVYAIPNQDDYDSISLFAKYPNGLPPYLREAIDSGWEIRAETSEP